ncbi:MAG: hypothetical protein WCT06_07725 [Armatimonadota bacterium]
MLKRRSEESSKLTTDATLSIVSDIFDNIPTNCTRELAEPDEVEEMPDTLFAIWLKTPEVLPAIPAREAHSFAREDNPADAVLATAPTLPRGAIIPDALCPTPCKPACALLHWLTILLMLLPI